MGNLHAGLKRARELASYSQEDAGAALGVSRVMVSYWEAGRRLPNDRQRNALARLYGVSLEDLTEGRAVERTEGDIANVLLRADDGIAPDAVQGIKEFVNFLDRYANLAEILQIPVHGMARAPLATARNSLRKRTSAGKQKGFGRSSDWGSAPFPIWIPSARYWVSPSIEPT